jgi:hypothetical protein
LFERAVQALVLGVLLRVPGRNAFGADAQPNPPDSQPRQAPAAREGRAIVGADDAGQAILAEGRREDGLDELFLRGAHDLAAQQEPTVDIADRQRIAAPPVPGPEPALEVRRPHVIGASRRSALRRGMRARPPGPARDGQARPLQQGANRARRRPGSRGVLLQPGEQLAGPPVRVLGAQAQDGPLRADREGRGLIVRGVRALEQGRRAAGFIPGAPLVPRLAADAEALAERAHRLLAQQTRCDELRPLIHGTGCSPRHRQGSSLPAITTCYPSARIKLLPISPVYTRAPHPPEGAGGRPVESLAARSPGPALLTATTARHEGAPEAHASRPRRPRASRGLFNG